MDTPPESISSMATGSDLNTILIECGHIDDYIDQIESSLEQLRIAQQRALYDSDSSASSTASRKVYELSTEIMSLSRKTAERVRSVKSRWNNPHVRRVGRRLEEAIQQHGEIESNFRKNKRQQDARQNRIVQQDDSEGEICAAVEGRRNSHIFTNTLMQSNRKGKQSARTALSAVRDRHEALAEIEQQVSELPHLFQTLDTQIEQHDSTIKEVEKRGEEVVDDLDGGNREMVAAVETAHKTRRKKFICFGISVAIALVLIVIILVCIFVIRGNRNG